MIYIGTSGYNYPEWKGSFYPADLAAAKMLPYYAARFPTVEINYTFYRMPSEKLLAGWTKQVPETFRFTLKSPRRITHDAKLANCQDLTSDVLPRRGHARRSARRTALSAAAVAEEGSARLDAFLDTLPPKAPAAFEFRHPSWFDDEVFARLKERGRALCVADSEKLETPLEVTADFGYFRLRDEGYQPADIEEWARKIAPLRDRCQDIYVYFKHEEQGIGPEFARQLMHIWGCPSARSVRLPAFGRGPLETFQRLPVFFMQ